MRTVILWLHNLSKEKLSLTDQYRILYRFEQLLKNGYNLNDVLEILKWEKHLRPLLQKMEELLYRGETFVNTLEKTHFNQEVIDFLKIAVHHGNLTYGLQQCCQLLQQRIQFASKLKKLSRYPLFLFLFFFIILYFMKTTIFPSFTQLLGTNQDVTSVFHTAEFVINIVFYGTIGSVIAGLLLIISTVLFKNFLSIEAKIKLFLCIPIYNRYSKMRTTYLLTTHLASLFQSGLTMKDSLQVIKSDQHQTIINHYGMLISDHLAQGYSYATILPQCQLLEDELTKIMIKDRNQTQMQKELKLYSDHLIQQIEMYLKKWITLLQPILLSVLALFVVFVYLSLMLPMFDYIQTM
ncbi:type II secretion system F family protein [Gracilibacillus kekensis]|uniref:Competence-related pilin export protein ComGB n=1 Tax=Gracilibacillus kekensis TaxID=1027249 RepID=A0A1M7P623_9BACI|nr:type II secretion system F family protein [Gracilibacillus kekensis]SHN12088.1 competence-related pilin export protein ComGB [Gracilibacillus kekensis]